MICIAVITVDKARKLCHYGADSEACWNGFLLNYFVASFRKSMN